MAILSRISRLYGYMSRRKSLANLSDETSLHRCLGVCDLTFLGIGGMVGSGIYVLVGIAAKDQAGPAILLSFLIAAVTIFLAAWCFTEFASRVSKTGSIYLFTYVSLGEFMAFLMGWCGLLGAINGAATNGRAWSAYLDSLLNHQITNFTKTHIANWTIGEPIAEGPDFVAAAIILITTVVVAMGVQCSAKFNAVFGGLNIAILMFASIVGFVYADIDNWTSPSTGGFLPFGWSGVFVGAGACFWAFTGFEIISMSVEETVNPKRAIPVAMVISLSVVLLLYLCTSASLTLVASYTVIDSEAPLPSAFAVRGISFARYIVSIGPLCGLTTALFSSIYGFVRMAYAMAEDGLIFSVFSHVNKRTSVPITTTIIGGILMALQATFLDLKNIISLGVVISLFCYILVDFCVIILRYRPPDSNPTQYSPVNGLDDLALHSPLNWKIKKFRETAMNGHNTSGSMTNLLDEETGSVKSDGNDDNSIVSDNLDHLESISQMSEELHNTPLEGSTGQVKPAFMLLCGCLQRYRPGRCVFIVTVISTVCLCILALIVHYLAREISYGIWWATTILILLCIIILLLQGVIWVHQQTHHGLVIKVPCIPWLPSLSILTCFILMVSTATITSWIGVVIEVSLGIIVYFSYSLSHSKLNQQQCGNDVEEVKGDSVALLQGVSDDDEEL